MRHLFDAAYAETQSSLEPTEAWTDDAGVVGPAPSEKRASELFGRGCASASWLIN